MAANDPLAAFGDAFLSAPAHITAQPAPASTRFVADAVASLASGMRAATIGARPRVYLAGPIKGLAYGEAVEWREMMAATLSPDIECYSPMRGKEYLRDAGKLDAFYPKDDVLANPRGIVARDYNDVRRADLVIAYLSGAEDVSIGTMFELAWCKAHDVPLIVVDDDLATSPHNHPFVTEVADWHVAGLTTAAFIARAVLLP